ncbi:MAG: methylated-DNA--[protein]-cysteine S-methyltransferase [Spirochaetota bacterium]|nr:methylated-DNA--[protein]-cysteine S-methyltransferase [Spirochaetota bacterium]
MINLYTKREANPGDLCYVTMESPLGELFLGSVDGKGLSMIVFLKNEGPDRLLDSLASRYSSVRLCPDMTLLKKTREELMAYFNGELREFSVEVDLAGTDFQNMVWKALMEIPYGETVCYSDIARKTSNEKSARAVGSANHRNPVPIIIPCHRVVGKDGSLTGYASGVDVKKWLIRHEKAKISRRYQGLSERTV